MFKNFRLLRRFQRCLSLLFHFKRPRLQGLDYLDIVVTQKPLLLISWNSKYPYLIKIPVVNKRYYTRSGSVLIHLPSGLESVNISVWSLWRKSAYALSINSFTIDPRAFEEYMNSYKILNVGALHNFEFSVSNAFSIFLPEVRINEMQAKVAIPSIVVSLPKFKPTKSPTHAQ